MNDAMKGGIAKKKFTVVGWYDFGNAEDHGFAEWVSARDGASAAEEVSRSLYLDTGANDLELAADYVRVIAVFQGRLTSLIG